METKKLSAKHNFPKAFDQVTMQTNLSEVRPPVLVDEPQNTSDKHIDHEFMILSGVKHSQRTISAERDFPKAFHQVPMARNLSEVLLPFSVDASKTTLHGQEILCNPNDVLESHELESDKNKPRIHVIQEESMICCLKQPKALDNIEVSDLLKVVESQNTGVSKLPKQRKVPLVQELPKGIAGGYKDNVSQVESDKGYINRGMFDLAYKSTDVVDTACISQEFSDDDLKDALDPSEINSLVGGSSISREMLGSDYDIRHLAIEHEDTDLIDLINTNALALYIERGVSAVRCFPPGCGRNAIPLIEQISNV